VSAKIYEVIPMADAIRCEIRNTQIPRYIEKEETCDNSATANIIIKAAFLKPFSGFHLSLLHAMYTNIIKQYT
jgi:hypothetical protein